MRTIVVALVCLVLAPSARAAESQQRIPGVISMDEKPATVRSGPVGTRARYTTTICNLGKRNAVWDVVVGIDPATPGLSAHRIDLRTETEDRGPTLPLFAGECARYQHTVNVDAGAPANTEVWTTIAVSDHGAPLLAVHRHFTVCPCLHHPR